MCAYAYSYNINLATALTQAAALAGSDGTIVEYRLAQKTGLNRVNPKQYRKSGTLQMLLLFFGAMLFLCLFGFLGQEYFRLLEMFDVKVLGVSMVSTINSPAGIDPHTLQNLLGLGVVFSEFVIVLISMLDRIGETLRDIVKPLFRLIPFGVFLGSIWKVFTPFAVKLLPAQVGEAVGVSQTDAPLTSAISLEVILISLVAMILFVIAHNALSGADSRASDEIRRLRRENARLKKELLG